MTPLGYIVWQDLTVPDADALSSFYCSVLGWHKVEDPSGDFNIFHDNNESPIAGICYARGVNADIPPQWLNYVMVDDVAARSKLCIELGGRIVHGPRIMAHHLFCVLQDPAGAYIAILSPQS